MQSLQYVGCNPLDKLGAIPRSVFRLTFLPQNVILPDSWFHAEWPKQMAEQLDRIGDNDYVYPIQDPATIINDDKYGQAAVVDVMVNDAWAGVAIQTAMQSVEDSYGYAKLSKVERIGPITTDTAAARPAEQQQTGQTEAKQEQAKTPGSQIRTAAGWVLLAAVIFVVGVAVWKAPKLA